MNQSHKRLEELLQKVDVLSPSTFSWDGQLLAKLPAKINNLFTPQSARDYLLYQLKNHLYNFFYTKGRALAKLPRETAEVTGDVPFLTQLSEANSGLGYYESGWNVERIEAQRMVVKKGELTLWARPEDTQAKELQPEGTEVQLRFPKELTGASPGFYMAMGDQPHSSAEEEQLVRVYWHLTPRGAVLFIQKITSLLNAAGLPFQCKVLKEPAHYTRCDAGVLYLPKLHYPAVSALLQQIYPELAPHLKAGTPAFTKQIAPGVGVSENPEDHESFGMNRCHKLADALIRAFEQGKRSNEERLQLIRERFAEDGIDLDTPYLNKGSEDLYPLLQTGENQVQPVMEISNDASDDAPADGRVYLDTAWSIGQRLAQAAVWYADRCTWVAPVAEDEHASTRSATSFSTLTPELYAGTSGVALFLAELYAVTQDAEIGKTAAGAIRQALARLETSPARIRLGFYTGWTGIAYAAARIGNLLQDAELISEARRVLALVKQLPLDLEELDLTSGNAGAILALLQLADQLHDDSLLEFAIVLGDQLLQTAERSERGCSWRTLHRTQGPNLTGFSHGASGIGFALLELHQRTGKPEYLHAAQMALQYETSCLNKTVGNWPDFRKVKVKQHTKQALQAPCATYWCHGAPGIALARLRAYELLQDDPYKQEALLALQTTAQMLQKALTAEGHNFSLCHGLAGNADILLHGTEVLGADWPEGEKIARAVGNYGIRQYRDRGRPWPLGATAGENLSLMLGLAGIGTFYLRLYRPEAPSVLYLRQTTNVLTV